MKDKSTFDFWYAVNNTEIVLLPSRHLETFGATLLNYHLVTELMDSVNQIRVREGRISAGQPRIITPRAYASMILDGFGEEARQYAEWLRDHEKELRILQYGYTLKQQSFSEQVITDNLRAVVSRVEAQVRQKGDPFSAVLVGVEEPWDVCLVKLFWEVIRRSAPTNLKEMDEQRLFEDVDGVPRAVRDELEKDFLAASRDPSLIRALARKLQQYGLFEKYQDRFFSLVRSSQR